MATNIPLSLGNVFELVAISLGILWNRGNDEPGVGKLTSVSKKVRTLNLSMPGRHMAGAEV
jgi:hypothetical protein